MPKAVLNHRLNNFDLSKFDNSIHRDIITSYIFDMRKYTYSPTEIIRIQKTYESIPSQLSKENLKFKYSIVQRNATKKEFELPLDWLESSNLIIKNNKVRLPEIPLSVYKDINSFKIYLSDVGLLNNLCKINFKDILFDTNFIFKDAITENYAAQQFVFNGHDIYYWTSKSDAKIDFVLDLKDIGIIPIEVKSSFNTRSRSLNQYMNMYNPKLGIRISMKNFGFENKIFSVPLYATFLI